ncbi:MAG: hypothetical protein GX063_05840 [Firmicutes bacterium]|nr:hypothetical protein [Bacillota bacterium]
MVARHKWLLLAVAVLSFCLGFVLTHSYWMGTVLSPGSDSSSNQAIITEEDSKTAKMPGTSTSEEAPKAEELRLLSEADLVQTVVSDSGEILETSTAPLPRELVGKTLEEVRSIHPEWRVVAFAPGRLTVRIPETHLEELYGHLSFLGIHDGKVAVFRGKPGVYQRLVGVTGIAVSSLPEFEIRNLEEGISFSGEEELSMLLESLRED